MSQVNSKTGVLDIDHQDQIGFQTSTVFENKMNCFFSTPSNFNCKLIDHWLQAEGWLRGQDTLVFCQCKKGRHYFQLLYPDDGWCHV